MKRQTTIRTLAHLALAVAVSLTCAEVGFADVIVTFPSASSTVIDSGGGSFDFCCFWDQSRGDSISQTYSGTALAAISGLDLSFTVDQNFLTSGNEVDWAVLVNGTQVGAFVWTAADGTGVENLAFAFAPIGGAGTYTLAIDVTNTVPIGGGSIGIAKVGSATLVGAVPEPASVMLLLSALGVLVLSRWRDARITFDNLWRLKWS